MKAEALVFSRGDVEGSGDDIHNRGLLLGDCAVLIYKLQELQENDHPLLNEEPLFDLPADIGDLKSDQ